MRTLKLLVIGLGVVIVVATVALVTIIVQRAGRLEASNTAGADGPIAVPPGFRIAGTDLSGDRLLVRLEGRAPGADVDEVRLLVLDLGGSNRQRTLRLMLPRAEAPR
jgi:hypothetical protein